jgi:hypothetical protein
VEGEMQIINNPQKKVCICYLCGRTKSAIHFNASITTLRTLVGRNGTETEPFRRKQYYLVPKRRETIDVFENQSTICMLHDDSCSRYQEPTYYIFPVDNFTNFAFTIATTPILCGVGLHRHLYPLMVACNYLQKKRPKVVASSSPTNL